MITSLFEDLLYWFTDPAIMNTYGYLGLFGASFLGSLLLFVPMPYFFLVVIASTSSNFDPTIIGIVSAIGATTAKVMIFQLSYTGSKLMSKSAENRLRPFMRLVSKYGGIAAFLAAITPIPDDLIYIPLGLARYGRMKFILFTLAGKIIFTMSIAWGVRLSLDYISFFITDVSDTSGAILITMIFFVLAIITIYTIIKLDWARVLGKWFPWTLENGS
ncbi:MAG: VTT domain-containing protein [Nitrososphaerales archaeon]|jgi:membrane protein YqaA with SNARE-associated domain|nr:VTT domain-containing protein [Nitrososphaerales archaeon]|tara:strand:+ start:562 stop:1212 length:651 start_codon:yes stop_codon:yes gene_type:complete